MKKRRLTALLLTVLPLLAWAQKPNEAEFSDLFNTSVSFDLLAVFPQTDTLVVEPFFAETLGKDSLFVSRARHIDEKVRPSKLCNLYSLSNRSKDNPAEVVDFFATFDPNALPQSVQGAWINQIDSIRDDLTYCLQQLLDAGYEQYWQERILPELNRRIEMYRIDPELIRAVHREIIHLAGGHPLGEGGSQIYIINIDNAFSLLDETFCCTPILLDPAIAKRYRIDFMQVYIHENLHRLPLSQELVFGLLEKLYEDDPFYREHETRARSFGEGGNEAFVVAAERFVSRRLGRIDDRQVYEEFLSYCDGSLVLAPIIYLRLPEMQEGESFDSFLQRIFARDIRPGKVKQLYRKAMKELAKRANHTDNQTEA